LLRDGPRDPADDLARWQRLLLPGGMREDTHGRSARDWVVDIAMFLLARATSAPASGWRCCTARARGRAGRGQGLANAEIATELHMSVATVKAHVSRLLAKLALDNRVQIALLVHDGTGGRR
jgi:hypothetical protein